MIDWQNELRPGVGGLAVEGVDDQKIVEAFLNGGMKAGFWPDWTLKLRVIPAGSVEKVTKELKRPDLPNNVWGLIDRDWRSDTEVADLQTAIPRLLILPRIMIDNYLVNPDTLIEFIPASKLTTTDRARLQSEIETKRLIWVWHGALAKVLYDHGAHQFCRGTTGYPRALLDQPITNEAEIDRLLNGWITHLNPSVLLGEYRKQGRLFEAISQDLQYQVCLDGKGFFNQVIILALNRLFGQKDRSSWLDELLQNPQSCPLDLQTLFDPLLK